MYSPFIRRLMISSLTVVISRALVSPLLTLFLSNKLGLNPQDVGLLLGIAVFSATLLSLYGGYIIDKLDKRQLLILAMLSSGIGLILLTFAQNLYLVTLVLIISETASALFLIGSKAILSENLPVGQRVKAFSLNYTLTNIGYAVGPMIGVVIAGVQPSAPFIVAGAIAIGSIFLLLGATRDASPITSGTAPQSFLNTLMILKNDRTMVLFTLGCLLSTLVHGRFTLYLSQYLLVTHTQQQTLDTMAALLACNAITVILLQYQVGRWLSREHLRHWIAGGTALFIVGLDWLQFGGQPARLVRGDVHLHLGRNDHLPGRLPLRRHPRPGNTARQLLRRAEPGGTRRRGEPGAVRVSADAYAGAEHVLRPERLGGAGRLSMLRQRAAHPFNAKIVH